MQIHTHLLAIVTSAIAGISVVPAVSAAPVPPVAPVTVGGGDGDFTRIGMQGIEIEDICGSCPRYVPVSANTQGAITTPEIPEDENTNQPPSNRLTRRSKRRGPQLPWNDPERPPLAEIPFCMDWMNEIAPYLGHEHSDFPDPAYSDLLSRPYNSSEPHDPLVNINVPRPWPISCCSDCNRKEQEKIDMWENSWVYKFSKKWGEKLGEWLGLGKKYHVEDFWDKAWVLPTDPKWTHVLPFARNKDGQAGETPNFSMYHELRFLLAERQAGPFLVVTKGGLTCKDVECACSE
ncbi:hypothetical protein BZA77DRAFT_293754 [Pyronema omphalodes]|nr:hypothetical protein BZA77DRAFT_293754 [Pyronema omphalodes]